MYYIITYHHLSHNVPPELTKICGTPFSIAKFKKFRSIMIHDGEQFLLEVSGFMKLDPGKTVTGFLSEG